MKLTAQMMTAACAAFGMNAKYGVRKVNAKIMRKAENRFFLVINVNYWLVSLYCHAKNNRGGMKTFSPSLKIPN